MEKYCPRCKSETNKHWKDASRSDGLCVYCVNCWKRYRKERPDIGESGMKVFQTKHLEYMSRYGKEWRRNHREKLNVYMRQYTKLKKLETIKFLQSND